MFEVLSDSDDDANVPKVETVTSHISTDHIKNDTSKPVPMIVHKLFETKSVVTDDELSIESNSTNKNNEHNKEELWNN